MVGLTCLGVAAQVRAADCIGVVPAGYGNAFWHAVQSGAEQAGKELGIEIYFRGLADESDVAAQAYLIDSVVKQHCKALVLAPNSPQRAQDIAMLKAQGIPTVYIDRDSAGSPAAGVVATDNFKAGLLAGKEMGKVLHGKGRVAILRLKKGIVSTSQREGGFIAGARQAKLTIALDAYLGTSVGEARGHAQQVLAQLSGTLDGVFTPNETTTIATLVVLKKQHQAGKLVHIGFDSSPTLIDALRHGDLYGLVVQRPFEMGYLGVRMAQSARFGLSVPNRNVDTGVSFVTRANLNQPAITRLLRINSGESIGP